MLRTQTMAFQAHNVVCSQSLIEHATVKLFLKTNQRNKHANIVWTQACTVALLLKEEREEEEAGRGPTHRLLTVVFPSLRQI